MQSAFRWGGGCPAGCGQAVQAVKQRSMLGVLHLGPGLVQDAGGVSPASTTRQASPGTWLLC